MAETIHGTSGNDSLKNTIGAGAMVYGYEGNDTVTNYYNNVYISGGSDNDSIESSSYASNVTIHGDDGYDNIYVSGSNAQIYGENGNDSVYVVRSNNGYIDGGTGNDTIDVWSAVNLTLTGGAGNDYIRLYGNSCFIAYNSGDGNDTITRFSDNATLNISGSYSTQESGNDVLVNVGNGSILLQGAKGTTLNITGSTSTTSGGGGGDTVTTPSGGSGVVIDNGNPNTLISGTDYADSIYSWGDYATINTYAGNDTVDNLGDTIQIDTGSGDDLIYSYSYYGTIKAGSGADMVSLGSSAHDNIIFYAYGDGNDIIYNLGTNNTLSISGGSYSTQVSGNDTLVHVGSGTITLAGSTSANIIGSSNPTPTTNNHLYTGGNGVISNYAGEQIIVGMLPKEWMFYGNDFYYGSNTGTLVVQDVKDKIIDFRDGYGNSFVKAYKATYSGVIDGRTWSGFEYIVGSDYGGDAIFAGDGGSSLWGGAGSYSDTLIGGAATDVFVTGKSQGSDVISNASIADVVWLRDVNFSDIKYTASSNGVIGMEFNTGNTLLVGSTSNLSAIFQFADGSSRRYNLSTKSWQST